MIIADRLYYLLSPQREAYTKVFYRRGLDGERLKPTDTVISYQDVERQVSGYLNEGGSMPALALTPRAQIFWRIADERTKVALLFSYHQRVVGGSRKVPNIEVDDWLSVPRFSELYERLRERSRSKKPWNLLGASDSYLATTGKHFRALRFDNIHLAIDILDGRRVFSIHWDTHAPGLSPLSWLKHWIFEDVPS